MQKNPAASELSDLISFVNPGILFFFCFRAGHIVFSAKSESGAGQEKKKKVL